MNKRETDPAKIQSERELDRLLKLFVSLGFFSVSWLWNLILRLAGKKGWATCVVLYYHRVPSEHRARFARQMDMVLHLAKRGRPHSKSTLTPGSHYVVVTFDDGYESMVKNALPELKKRGIPATIFVITDALGQTPRWDSFGSGLGEDDKVMSAEQLRKLGLDGVIIGSHTMTHRVLPRLSEDEARREIAGSRAKLEEILGKRVKVFSFPYGAFNQKLVELCREAGYERVFTTSPVLAFRDPQEFITGRTWAEPTDWRLEFRLKLLGAYRWLPLAFALKRKILQVFMVWGMRNPRLEPRARTGV